MVARSSVPPLPQPPAPVSGPGPGTGAAPAAGPQPFDRRVILVGGIVFAVLMALSPRYGFHRDELYFLDSARHLQWAGGCNQSAGACEVHHTKHKANGGKTSVKDCVLLCPFHHQVVIHRQGRTLVLTPTAPPPPGTRTKPKSSTATGRRPGPGEGPGTSGLSTTQGPPTPATAESQNTASDDVGQRTEGAASSSAAQAPDPGVTNAGQALILPSRALGPDRSDQEHGHRASLHRPH
jgi:hypothetical protein